MPHKGIYVRVIKDFSVVHGFPGSKPLVLSVDAQGRFYLDSRQIAQGDLFPALQDALWLCGDKVIYIQGDSDAEYRSVVNPWIRSALPMLSQS